MIPVRENSEVVIKFTQIIWSFPNMVSSVIIHFREPKNDNWKPQRVTTKAPNSCWAPRLGSLKKRLRCRNDSSVGFTVE